MGITKDTRGADKPATSVSWNEAGRFINWLNTSEGFTPAYKFAVQPGEGGYNANADIELWQSGDAGFNAANPFRNDLARYFLPSVNEWYKAAYYDPNGSLYFDYPTGSDTAPTAVASGTTAGTAVYNQSGPADITLAGGLSPYGTMGQGGNVFEWEETEFDLVNDSSSSSRAVRGGFWNLNSDFLRSSDRFSDDTTKEAAGSGFRVASIPGQSSPACDFDGGGCGLSDINLMMMQGDLVAGVSVSSGNQFDLDNDNDIDEDDITEWLSLTGTENGYTSPMLRGDTDNVGASSPTSRTVDITDFQGFLDGFTGAGSTWEVGNFNGDGVVDITDFSNKFLPSFMATGGGTYGAGQSVPEPGTVVLLVTALGVVVLWRAQR